jgi:hypothetical protein
VAKPPYTQLQLIDKAYTAIQETGLFATACLEWNVMESDRWIDLKDHFTEAYEAFLVTSAGSAAQHGYASNMLAPGLPMPGGTADDDSLNTIRDGFASHTMAFNAQAQRQGDEISGLRAAMMEMGAAHQQQLHRMEQNMAHMARSVGGAATVPTTISTITQPAPPPVPVFAASGYIAPATHAPTATTTTTTTTRRSRGRRAGFGAAPPATSGTYAQRAATGTTTAATHVQNDYKIFNNWNKCFSCGSDVPAWHTSATCPAECRVPGHQAGYVGRTNTGQVAPDHAQYVAAGHKPSERKSHKKYLPRAGTGRP